MQGVAYDLLKAMVLRVLKLERQKPHFRNIEFTKVIIKTEYTRRLQRRKKRRADLEKVEETIRERYDLIVRKGNY